MIRLFLALVISFFIGFLPYVSTYPIYHSLPNTLYTLSGIMFSVGMSLVVTMSTQGIHNKEAKVEVQNKIQKLLMKYVLYFSILTLLYILLPSEKEDDIFSPLHFSIIQVAFVWNYAFSFVIFSIFSMIYFIINMLSVRRQNNEIERLIDEEQDF